MLYNVILEKIFLPIGDFITGSSFVKNLKYWRKVDLLNEIELQLLQESNLARVLKHAVANTQRYSDIVLDGDSSFEWLKNFPILTKELLRKIPEELLTENISKLTKISSSGSSGISSSVFMNANDLSILRAATIHLWEWSGYVVGDPLIQTGISTKRGFIKAVKDILFKTSYISAFSHSPEQLKKLCNKLERTAHFYLIGYASSLNVIAEYALKNGYKIELKSVVSLGDKLFSHYKKNIQKAFHCKVYDTYGSAEGFQIAAQADLEYLYILSPQTYIEILDDDDNPVADGVMGNIVVTRLDGYAMPLIRYKIGDLGILLPRDKYPKERRYQYPLLQQIVGRDTDVVKTPNGKILVVHSFTGIFEHVVEIQQFKIIQRSVDGIIIEYIPSKGFNEKILIKITSEIEKIIKEKDFFVKFIKVSVISPTNSGKPQIVESQI
jgi:phenylacetate-CoA ligase